MTPIASDAALIAALGGPGEPAMRFVGEGRIGDRGGAATFEYDVGNTTAAPAATGNLAWANGEQFRFSFDYNATSRLATLSFFNVNVNLTNPPPNPTLQPQLDPLRPLKLDNLDPNVLTASFAPANTGGFNAIFLRAFASAAPSTSVLFEDLQLWTPGEGVVDVPGYTGTNISNASGGELVRLAIAEISGVDLADGFTLGGSVGLTWSGAAPTNSNLAFQFKVAEVPEPGTYALLALGLAVLMGASLRRRHRYALATSTRQS